MFKLRHFYTHVALVAAYEVVIRYIAAVSTTIITNLLVYSIMLVEN